MAEAQAGATDGAATADDIEIDVVDFIDRQPVGRFQIGLLLTCAAVLFIDGFDTQAVGYVAPAVAQEWKLARGTLGPVFSSGLFGLMLGALVVGPIADRIGRRQVIIASTAVFGLATLATVFAQDVNALLTIRFLTGIGLGGAMPNTVALVTEFSPRRRRATMVMSMFAGFSIGAATGGLIAAALIPYFGWRSVFVVGGVVPLLLLPFLIARLPESIRFLVFAGGADQTVAALLTRLAPTRRPPARAGFRISEGRNPGIPVSQLFMNGRTAATLAFWLMFFMSLLDLFLLANWLPTVLNDLGASISLAAVIGAMLQIGGFVGVFALGSLIDRFSFVALALVYLGAAAAVSTIGYAGHSVPLVTLAIFCSGFGIVGGQTAANALAATYYPTDIRSTGVGWALGIGRVGSIVGPLVGGMMLSRQVGAETLFLAAAVPALFAAAAAFALSRLVEPI